jgi:hypothetical protein
MNQLRPFHRSMKSLPTAMHDVVDPQETSTNPDRVVVVVGVGWIDHRLPFQRSASVPIDEEPTASHSVVETHETPLSVLELAPGSFGVR